MTKDNVLLGKFELTGLPPAPRGVPQIEVTFEIDANGILNVGAEDKATGNAERITITADKGRLSEEEIERMIREAEEFAEEDKLMKETIDAKNALESYAYNMKNTVTDDEKLGDKLDEDDKQTVLDAVDEAIEFLENNLDADKEEYEEALKTLESACNPIIEAAYKEHGAPGGAPPSDDDDFDDDDDFMHDEL